MLPEGDWKASESEAIATRLVNWLPGRSTQAIPSVEARLIGGKKMKSGFATVLARGVLAAALLFLGLHLLGQSRIRPERGYVHTAIAEQMRWLSAQEATNCCRQRLDLRALAQHRLNVLCSIGSRTLVGLFAPTSATKQDREIVG